MTENIHKHRIHLRTLVLQYTQLVARRVRELGVYCELWAWDVTEAQIREFNPSTIILSGGPESTTEENRPARTAVRVRSGCASIQRLRYATVTAMQLGGHVEALTSVSLATHRLKW